MKLTQQKHEKLENKLYLFSLSAMT